MLTIFFIYASSNLSSGCRLNMAFIAFGINWSYPIIIRGSWFSDGTKSIHQLIWRELSDERVTSSTYIWPFPEKSVLSNYDLAVSRIWLPGDHDHRGMGCVHRQHWCHSWDRGSCEHHIPHCLCSRWVLGRRRSVHRGLMVSFVIGSWCETSFTCSSICCFILVILWKKKTNTS